MAKNKLAQKMTGVTLGEIVEVNTDCTIVTFEGSDPVDAQQLSSDAAYRKGDAVALMFQDGDPNRPMIIGLINLPTVQLAPGTRIVEDSQSIALTHPRRIELRCGKAVIVMTSDGRIELNGDYLLSTARGMNRIAGASVKIN